MNCFDVRVAVLSLALATAGCSGDDDGVAKDEDHVWKGQVEAVDKARDVGRQLDEAAKQRERAAQQ